jgi:hypothetical protein
LRDSGLALAEIRGLLADNVSPEEMHRILATKRDVLAREVEAERFRLARATARLDLVEQHGLLAAHDVAMRTTGAWLVASLRGLISTHEESDALFDKLDHLTGRRRERRRRGAVWHACREGAIDCEAFEFVSSDFSPKGDVEIREMPGRLVVSLVYRGDADYLPAYRAMRLWIAACGMEIAGPKREIYLDNGTDAGEAITEIQFPVVSGTEDIH